MTGELTLSDLATFKKKYKEAIKKGVTTFQFKGNEILVDYAKYMIEYCTLNFNNGNN